MKNVDSGPSERQTSELQNLKGDLQKLSEENSKLRSKLENEYVMSAKLSNEKQDLEKQLANTQKDESVVQEVMRVK